MTSNTLTLNTQKKTNRKVVYSILAKNVNVYTKIPLMLVPAL